MYYKEKLELHSDETVYAIWIGINDIGAVVGKIWRGMAGVVGELGKGDRLHGICAPQTATRNQLFISMILLSIHNASLP